MAEFDLHSCVVSIRHQSHPNSIAGTGFIVDNHHILTCFHVIKQVGAIPGSEVKFCFNKIDEIFDGWVSPTYYRDESNEDVCVITFNGKLPAHIQAAPLAHPQDGSHPFKLFGYRNLSPDLGPSYAHGIIVDFIDHRAGFQVLQLSSQQEIAGMSGGPVLDTDQNMIVGMVLSQSNRDNTKIALPVTEIKRIWPELPLPYSRDPMPSAKPDVPEMIHVPAGKFLMGSLPGSPHANENEIPQQEMHVSSFYLAKYPVTNEEYGRFVTDTCHRAPDHWVNGRPPEDKLNHPVVMVSFNDAHAYCQWLSNALSHLFRLPSEEEWEKAARGTSDTRIYTWGDQWEIYRCNSSEDNLKETTPVNRFEGKQENPYGIADMMGNVAEWTISLYAAYKGSTYASINFMKTMRVVRGGSYMHDRTKCRVSQRGRYEPKEKKMYLGFRLASTNQMPEAKPVGKSEVLTETSAVTSNSSDINRNRQLRKLLENHFSLSDLNQLVFDLELKKDNFPQKLSDMARELLEECQRRGLTSQLIALLKQERPHVNWDLE